ncbi:MAG: cation transporter [Chitinophagaceae bacterium]|nr:cation transporter [Chitinophagaceae bacterium]
MNTHKGPAIRMQAILVVVSVCLFLVKIVAWYLSGSVAILTDALEGTVNVVAGFIGLYSIILSSKPKDKEHPYGHGKVEFLSSAIEGLLISLAGLIIIYEAINNLIHPHALNQLDYGIILIAITAIVNYVVGYFCVKKGHQEHSPILVASGAHLKSDAYSTLGLIIGLILILITDYHWMDSLVALIFAFIIIITGYKILRKAISGIMDESDSSIIDEIVILLNRERQPKWIDVHNMRVINYAGYFHIDCHLTVPYYINVNQAHEILDSLTLMFKRHFDDKVEFFIHIDGCVPVQCSICSLNNCVARKSAFQQHVDWTHENILSNSKHYGQATIE